MPTFPGWPSRPGVGNAPTPNLPQFVAPPPFSHPDYTQPDPWSYQDWTPPTIDEAINSPGYQFRLGQGTDALQKWAAARGTLNDSGTAKALMDYGQNAASQEYGNVWNRGLDQYRTNRGNALESYNLNELNRLNTYRTNREGALGTYNTNYRTQHVDPYQFEYTRQTDLWEPQMETWREQNRMNALGFTQGSSNAWNLYINDWEKWKDRRDNEILLGSS